MNHTGPQSAAWAAVLPPGTSWLPGNRAGSRRLRRAGSRRLTRAGSAGTQGRRLAATAPPWSLAGSSNAADPSGLRSYIAVPSQQAPILIASRDRAVLRYVAGSVLSVPPGAGTAASMVLTAGLSVLRFRLAWNLLALVRLARLVVVGWSR
jgi:hypothetical protein